MKVMFLPEENSSIYRYIFIIAFLFIAVIGMKMTAYIINILVISLILTMLALPTMMHLRKRGLPDIVSVSLLTALALIFILILGALTVFSFSTLVADLPYYQVELNQRLSEITGFLSNYGFSGDLLSESSIDLQTLTHTIASSLIKVGDLLLYLFFIGVTTFFMLLEAPHIIDRGKALMGGQRERFIHVSRMSRYMIEFVIVRTQANLVHGVLFGGILWLMGVHAAMLWGILTFILAYIPYIGLIIAAIPAIFFAWLQFGWWGAAAVIAVVCILNLVVENPVFSYFASRRFEIPALLVIISVIFWGWVLGIAGMVFAVPITLILLIAMQCIDELSWVSTLLGVDKIFGEKTDASEPKENSG
jgi:AI-2 transport protein TqsA